MEIKHDQHLMVDNGIIGKMVDFAQIKPKEVVLEIGAGRGFLTKELASRSKNVIAVEIDAEFRKDLKKIKGARVVIGNALEEIDSLEFDKIVANIPYAICEPLMHKLFGIEFILAVLTIPKGFAGIITAAKDSVEYSRISAITRALFDVEVLMDVPREAFDPEPDTDSVVVKLVPKEGNVLQKEVIKRQKLKVKNAIMRSLFMVKKMGKNEARKAIKTLKLNKLILEKRLFEADLEELDAVLDALKTLE